MNNYKTKIRTSRSLRTDNSGVLGLPLNLLIMVVIAAVSIGIILAWLFLLTPPLEYIEVQVNGEDTTTVKDVNTANATFDVSITAYNDKGTMSGCEVTIEGIGIDYKAITDENGYCEFLDVTPNLPPNTNSDFIKITVSGGGNVVTQSIAVNK